jgi:hypothetical protein
MQATKKPLKTQKKRFQGCIFHSHGSTLIMIKKSSLKNPLTQGKTAMLNNKCKIFSTRLQSGIHLPLCKRMLSAAAFSLFLHNMQ